MGESLTFRISPNLQTGFSPEGSVLALVVRNRHLHRLGCCVTIGIRARDCDRVDPARPVSGALGSQVQVMCVPRDELDVIRRVAVAEAVVRLAAGGAQRADRYPILGGGGVVDRDEYELVIRWPEAGRCDHHITDDGRDRCLDGHIECTGRGVAGCVGGGTGYRCGTFGED